MILSRFGRALMVTAVVSGGLALSGSTKSAADIDKSGSGSSADGSMWLDGGRTVQDGRTDWVVGYANPLDEPGAVTITDPVIGAQRYESGSLTVPPGWNGQVSESDSGATTMIASSDTVPPGGRGVTTALTPPVLTSFSQTSSGGDGYRPILWTNPDDPTERRMYAVFHHSGTDIMDIPNGNELWCTTLPSGDACPGFPRPYTLPSMAASGRWGTPNWVEEVRVGDRIFFPYGDATTYGAGCLDLATGLDCGYTVLSDTAVPDGGLYSDPADFRPVTVAPFVYGFEAADDGRFYGMAYDTSSQTGSTMIGPPPGVSIPLFERRTLMVCFEVNAGTAQPCADSNGIQLAPNGGYTAPPSDNAGELMHSDTVADGDRMYTISTHPLQVELGCAELPSGSPCAGWESPRVLAGDVTQASGFLSYAAGEGESTGVCVRWWEGSGQRLVNCFDTNGVDISASVERLETTGVGGSIPPSPGNIYPGRFVPELGRTFFPIFQGSVGGALCWDWATDDSCSGFDGDWVAKGFAPSDYGYSYDDATGCMWGNGDTGMLWSFDPYSGVTPCTRSRSTSDLVTPTDSYCDGQAGHVSSWGVVRLHNADGVNNVRITVRDGVGNLVPGWSRRVVSPDDVAAGLELDSIGYESYPSIAVEVEVGFSDTSWWTDSNYPTASVTFEGDPVQLCFSTQVLDRCETNQLENEVNAVAKGIHSGSAASESDSESIAVDRRAHACPDLVIDKAVDSDNFIVGESLTYTLSVTNREKVDPAQGTDAVDVIVRDVLPQGVEYVPSRVTAPEDTGAEYDPVTRTLEWTIPGPIDPNETVILTYPVVVVDKAIEHLANTAVITNVGETPEPSPEAPDASAPCADIAAFDGVSIPCADTDTDRAGADLTVSKTALTETVESGETAKWRILVRNSGSDAAADVVITEMVPPGVAVTSLSPSRGSCDIVALSCRIGDLEPDGAVSVLVAGTVALDHVGDRLTNTASAASPTPDADTSDNFASSAVDVGRAEDGFSIIKSTDLKSVRSTDEILYTVTVRNEGKAVASPEVLDVPNVGLELLEISSPNGRCSLPKRSCELADLQPGNSAVVWVLAKVSANFTGSFVENSARVRSCCDGEGATEWSSSVSIPIAGETIVGGVVQVPKSSALARTGQNMAGLLWLGLVLVMLGDILTGKRNRRVRRDLRDRP